MDSKGNLRMLPRTCRSIITFYEVVQLVLCGEKINVSQKEFENVTNNL
jgi:hypothetical protein